MDRHIDMGIHMHTCLYRHVEVYEGVCGHVCQHFYGMCVDTQDMHVYGHVYGHAYGHMYGHVYGYRHLCRHV